MIAFQRLATPGDATGAAAGGDAICAATGAATGASTLASTAAAAARASARAPSTLAWHVEFVRQQHAAGDRVVIDVNFNSMDCVF